MIKYSLQNECLENIEAFTDEQMNREMAVIESVLDVFDKTCLMMELSNSDVNIPDCSMFMESTFFQEAGDPPTGDAQPATSAPAADGGGDVNNASGGGSEESNPAPASDQSSNNNASSDNNTQNGDNKDTNTKSTFTEKDQKAYNKEHWVRMKNKEGKLENIFISIIAFIPRLFGFLIQSIVKLFKKIGDKETKTKTETINNTPDNVVAEAAANMPKDAVDAVDSPQPQEEPKQGVVSTGAANHADGNLRVSENKENKENAGELDDSNKKNSKWFNCDKLATAYDHLRVLMEKLYFENEPNMNTKTAKGDLLRVIESKCGEFAKSYEQVKNELNSALTDLTEQNNVAICDQNSKIINAGTNLQRSATVILNQWNQLHHKMLEANKRNNEVDNESFRQSMMNVFKPIKATLQQIKELVNTLATANANIENAWSRFSKNMDILLKCINNISSNKRDANSNYQKDINKIEKVNDPDITQPDENGNYVWPTLNNNNQGGET